MTRPQDVELLSIATNCAVVRVPGRSFPGAVVQGDTLRGLLDLASEILRRSAGGPDPELEEAARGLHEQLSDLIAEYEAALRRHRLPLPYQERRDTADTYAG
ncbi:MAG TPA: hypothetical protein VFG43_16635 [Geminicoccaceae bacterium]|nr:hypothetical protein [Geminicoccaceae bacterium]